MKLFPEGQVFVVGEAGFDDKDADEQPLDVLGRKALGQKLTDLVERINQPLVIALDGGWGSGKSHFLKLWTGAHSKELGGKAEVIYFDAFEHDYLDDPLVSLVSRLTSERAAKTWGAKAVSSIKKAAFPLAKLTTRLGLAAATYGGSEVVGALGDAVIGKLSDSADATIEQFWQAESGRIAAMQGFRDALVGLTNAKAKGGNPQKIVFIVDELDRCRPDYALSLLEIIKHFFAVPNVHFVLGVNLEALGHSVNARYGAGLDGTKYLDKFVSLRMDLPFLAANPDAHLSEVYLQNFAKRFVASSETIEEAIVVLGLVLKRQNVTLRDVQRILSILALFPASFQRAPLGYRHLVVAAAYFRVLHPKSYALLRSKHLTLDDATRLLALEMPSLNDDSSPQHDRWSCWSIIANGDVFLGLDTPYPGYSQVIAGHFSHGTDRFSWRNADRYLSEAFDSFTLPSP